MGHHVPIAPIENALTSCKENFLEWRGRLGIMDEPESPTREGDVAPVIKTSRFSDEVIRL